MIKQNDMRLRSPIRQYGCYFMSLLWHINRYTNTPLSVQRINSSIYHGAVQQGFMTSNCYVQDPTGFCQWLGWDAVYTGKHEKPDYICGPNEAEILLFKHDKAGDHFVAGDGKGNVTYDPWYHERGGSLCASEGVLVSKRIFKF